MILPIYVYGQPVLRKVAEDITPEYPNLKELIANMFETMVHADGVGLAAPQIGLPIRVVTITLDPLSEDYPEFKDFNKAYINRNKIENNDKTTVIPDITPKKTVSLKSITLNNGTQKVNDVLGNPIIIGAVVIWKVTDPTKAVFNVDNYAEFLSIQTDSTIRNIARKYPYDDLDCEDENMNEKTLRSSSLEIANDMKDELIKRVQIAGLDIEEVRITHLAYAEEIAAAMLQRQQASAIIAARQKIVDGAVGMVKMAIDKLGEEEVVVLDEERKATMVSNLLVVLCSNKDTQPVVNSGSIY